MHKIQTNSGVVYSFVAIDNMINAKDFKPNEPTPKAVLVTTTFPDKREHLAVLNTEDARGMWRAFIKGGYKRIA